MLSRKLLAIQQDKKSVITRLFLFLRPFEVSCVKKDLEPFNSLKKKKKN